MMNYKTHHYIEDYFKLIENGEIIVCKEQYQLMDLVKNKLSRNDIYIDAEKIEKAVAIKEKYFYKEFPYQKFIDCFIYGVFYSDGSLVFDEFLIMMGRGNGKNGFIAPNEWYMSTNYHGIKRYNVENVANSEDQAKISFDDICDMLNDNEEKMKKHFRWTKEKIESLKTHSVIRWRTSNAKTKDGLRPGVIVFDEIHQYETYANINVYTSALGKVAHPRIFYISTDGYIREKVLDDFKSAAAEILRGERPDSRLFPFICKLDSEDEIDNPKMWVKANPSYYYLPNLRKAIDAQHKLSLKNPQIRLEIKTKRFNLPSQDLWTAITDEENIMATNQPLPDLSGEICIGCLDYAETTDFVGMGLLFKKDGKYYFLHHTYICHKSLAKAQPKINVEEAVERGWCTVIKKDVISPDIVVDWFLDKAQTYRIREVVSDRFRVYTMRDAFRKSGIQLIEVPSGVVSHNKVAATLDNGFASHNIVFGDDKLMRWYLRNVYIDMDKKGNKTYLKIEPRLRKTDGFFAFLSGMIREMIEPLSEPVKYTKGTFTVRTYGRG